QNTHFESKELVGKAIDEMIMKNRLSKTEKRYNEVLVAMSNTSDDEKRKELKDEFTRLNRELKNLKR
ncbi:MAG TPA: hypothetical protein DDZ89_14275, partial [Clostridiales bacterium]|nr:hypothetical protein [Clostridiales bacterium]